MLVFRLILLACLALVSAAGPAAAQSDAAPKVTSRLIAEQDEIAPGGQVNVALEENIRPGWHTYWQNPGEAGEPTQIDWTLPRGWKAGAIAWPFPKRLPVGPLMNYGYEGKPWLLTTLSAPADAASGATVPLKAHVSWLVCSPTLCVPEDATLALTLSVAAHPAAPYATVAAAFAAARAAIPVASPWPVTFQVGRTLDLFVAAPPLAQAQLQDAQFFPAAEGLVKGMAPQILGQGDGGIGLRLVPAPGFGRAKRLDGVLVLTSADGSVQALDVHAVPGTVPPLRFAEETGGLGIALALGFAFLGGLILNLMPCVLPILAMKALHLASQAGARKGEGVREGLSYGLGAILSFAALGGAVVALRGAGNAVGWGFQLQDPRVVAAFALLMLAVGLNLSGVFELAGVTAGDSLARKGGAMGAFFTGVLAVAVAAPCTAPFMAAALGYALTQDAATAVGVFVALGAGFAAPFVAIGLSPPVLRLMPKPGAWMLHFKQFLAFPMYGAAAWLVWVVAQEAGAQGLAFVLAAMVALAFAAWAWSASRNASSRWRSAGGLLALLGLLTAVAGASFAGAPATASAPMSRMSAGLAAEAYSPARLAELRAAHRPVFLDATAAWCITCLVNERVALDNGQVARAFAATHTAYLVADWTRRDAAITQLLSAYGRSGVPLYLYYKPGAAQAVVLPQILTPDTVLAAMGKG